MLLNKYIVHWHVRCIWLNSYEKSSGFQILLTTCYLLLITVQEELKLIAFPIKDFNSDTYIELIQTFDRSVKPRGCLHGGRKILEGESSLHHMFSVFY